MPKLIFNFPFHNQIFKKKKKSQDRKTIKKAQKIHICAEKMISPKVLLCLITAKMFAEIGTIYWVIKEE